jgi:hypothetical protein
MTIDLDVTSLAQHEAAIEAERDGFLDRTSSHFVAIRDGRLYARTHPTFQAYCTERWGLTERHVNRLIQHAGVSAILGPIGPEINEAQARELAPLLDQPEAMRQAWEQVNEQTDGKPTAAAIRNVVRPQPSPPPEPLEAATSGGELDLTGVAMTREQFLARRDSGEVLSVEDWQAQQAQDELDAQRADTDARYVANLFRAVTASNTGLLALDPQRAVETCRDLPDERDSLLAFLARVQAWADHVRAGLRPNLRSVR